jgi:hypothetical protein
MNLTATQVVTRALRAAKVLGLDQPASTFMLTEGLTALQGMLARWRADSQLHDGTDFIVPTFSDLTTPVAVPDGLVDAYYYELAGVIAAENGSALDPRIARNGQASLALWRRTVGVTQVPELAQEVTYIGTANRPYDIFAS